MTANPDLGILFWIPSSVFVALTPAAARSASSHSWRLRRGSCPGAHSKPYGLLDHKRRAAGPEGKRSPAVDVYHGTDAATQVTSDFYCGTSDFYYVTSDIYCGTSAAVPLAYAIRRLFLVEHCVSRRHAARHMLARYVDVPITRILVWTGHDGIYDQQADLVPFLVARQVSRILPRAPLTVVLPLPRVAMANIGVTLCEGDNERSRFVGKAKSLDFANRLFSQDRRRRAQAQDPQAQGGRLLPRRGAQALPPHQPRDGGRDSEGLQVGAVDPQD